MIQPSPVTHTYTNPLDIFMHKYLLTQTTLCPMIQPILVTCTYKPIIPNSTQHIRCVILL